MAIKLSKMYVILIIVLRSIWAVSFAFVKAIEHAMIYVCHDTYIQKPYNQ